MVRDVSIQDKTYLVVYLNVCALSVITCLAWHLLLQGREGMKRREKLLLALSRDDGATWVPVARLDIGVASHLRDYMMFHYPTLLQVWPVENLRFKIIVNVIGFLRRVDKMADGIPCSFSVFCLLNNVRVSDSNCCLDDCTLLQLISLYRTA